MLVLGLAGATRSMLSWDEIATVDVARRSVPQIWRLMQHIDGVFGPYYLLMHFWTAVAGRGVLEVRLPSIVAMAGAAALTGELGRRLFGTVAGLVGGLVFCAVPNISRYAAEARPYAMACLVSVLGLILLHRALTRPGRARWLAYGAAVVGLGLSHVIALTALGAHGAVVLMCRRRAIVPWAVSVAVALVVLGPIFWLGSGQRGAQLHWVPPLTVKAVRNFPVALTGSAEVAWLLIGLAVTAGWRVRRHVLAMAFSAVIPLGVILVVSAHGPSFWVNRYLLFVLAPTAILAAVALCRAGALPGGAGALLSRAGTVRVVAVLLLLAAVAYPAQWTVRGRTVKNGTDDRSVARIVQAGQQPGDGIIYQPGSRTLRPGVDYYLRDDPGRPRDLLLRRDAADEASLVAGEWPGTADRLGAGRVWLLVGAREEDPLAHRADLAAVLRTRYVRAGIWQVKRGTLALFVPRTVGP
ncbi:glycosyltransferase family 39 protein [Winogradskya humida]|nr:glycosyltransferase family 39 protein [Actinoplanes humidus]